MADIATLVVQVNAQGVATLNAQLTKLQTTSRGMTVTGNKMGSMFGSVTRQILAGAGLVMGITMLTRTIKNAIVGSISYAASLEQIGLSFEILLKSATKAHNLMSQIKEFSAETPLQFEPLAAGAQRLIAFGSDSEVVIKQMRMLGDLAQGDQEKLDSLVNAFGRVQARGKASMREINRFIFAGVPIIQALADEFGVTNDVLFDMLQQGKVTFDVLNKAMVGMTSGTGQFTGMMERQSKTLKGLMTTLKDNVSLLGVAVVDPLLPALKRITVSLIAFTKGLRETTEAARNAKIIQGGAGNYSVDAQTQAASDSIRNYQETVVEVNTALDDFFEERLKAYNRFKLKKNKIDLETFRTGFETGTIAATEGEQDIYNILVMESQKYETLIGQSERLLDLGEKRKNQAAALKLIANQNLSDEEMEAIASEKKISLNLKYREALMSITPNLEKILELSEQYNTEMSTFAGNFIISVGNIESTLNSTGMREYFQTAVMDMFKLLDGENKLDASIKITNKEAEYFKGLIGEWKNELGEFGDELLRILNMIPKVSKKITPFKFPKTMPESLSQESGISPNASTIKNRLSAPMASIMDDMKALDVGLNPIIITTTKWQQGMLGVAKTYDTLTEKQKAITDAQIDFGTETAIAFADNFATIFVQMQQLDFDMKNLWSSFALAGTAAILDIADQMANMLIASGMESLILSGGTVGWGKLGGGILAKLGIGAGKVGLEAEIDRRTTGGSSSSSSSSSSSDSSMWSDATFASHDSGGVLNEPVIGRGLRSGNYHGFAMNGPEEFGGVGTMGSRGGGGDIITVVNQNIAGTVISDMGLSNHAVSAVNKSKRRH